MTPYFQLAIPSKNFSSEESVQIQEELLSLLMEKGFEAYVREEPIIDSDQTVLNIEVSNIRAYNEEKCMSLISKFSKQKNCTYRFRFLTFIEVNCGNYPYVSYENFQSIIMVEVS